MEPSIVCLIVSKAPVEDNSKVTCYYCRNDKLKSELSSPKKSLISKTRILYLVLVTSLFVSSSASYHSLYGLMLMVKTPTIFLSLFVFLYEYTV